MNCRRRPAAISVGLLSASLLIGCGQSGPAPSGDGGRYSGARIETLPDMLKGLRSREASTRARSAASIGGMGPAAKEAIPALITLLKDREPSVRAASAHALGKMGPAAEKASPDLKALAKQSPLRKIATEALERIGTAE